ncbi:MAG: amylo-alpha-1,6-glucosidase [Firmicutes bacterium]|nr:amylo-alpha-1,6-glucosidase [Bacillota bacterium]
MDIWRISPQEIQPVTEVLKEGEVFLVSLPSGEITRENRAGLGLYYMDTRFLSCLEVYLAGTKPVFLSGITRGSHFSQIETTNSEIKTPEGAVIPLQTLHLRTLRVLKHSLYQRMRFVSFAPCPVSIRVRFVFCADFADIFEVRGARRAARGSYDPLTIRPDGFLFSYLGRDQIRRSTLVAFSPAPAQIWSEEGHGIAEFELNLPPQKKRYIFLQVTPFIERPGEKAQAPGVFGYWPGSPRELDNIEIAFPRAAYELEKSYAEWRRECTSFTSDNGHFNQMVSRAVTDLRALMTDYAGMGRIVDAGIPWYATPFGRDALITSWETLILNPEIAKDSLRFLAGYQGQKIDSWREERPGKIFHEIRRGEMACAEEVPHTPYYGSVDATLWFVILLAEVYYWTGDQEFLEEMAGPLYKCLDWYRKYGDLDGDGYVEYLRESEHGLTNQGWKDSWDGVVDKDGSIPRGPLALVEVQAYLYLALRYAADLMFVLGDYREGAKLHQEASRVRDNFLRDFWLQDEGFLAFCLDYRKRPLKTIVSNAGQCLFTGILPAPQAEQVAHRLFAPDLYSGWGIRTMSAAEKAYNPMSYHNGSVWPHDNAIIAQGLRRYGQFALLDQLLTDVFEAALFFPYYRLPELFCGFARREVGGPVRYPTSCDPQAWAVGSIFLFLRAMLGLSCREKEVRVGKPFLPKWLNELYVQNLAVGSGRVDLEFARSRGKTFCNVIRCEGDIKVTIQP